MLDIDFDVRISGVIGLGRSAGNQRFRIEEAPRGVLRALRAAEAEIGEDVQVGRQAAGEILRLLPYSGGSGAGNEVRHVDADEQPADREIQSPSSSHSQQGAAGPGSSQGEFAEAERLFRSLASALALRLLSQAATRTRRAIAEAKRAMKGKDPDRIRQANDRLREAAMQLAEALRRVNTASPMDEERDVGSSDPIDAEFEPTT